MRWFGSRGAVTNLDEDQEVDAQDKKHQIDDHTVVYSDSDGSQTITIADEQELLHDVMGDNLDLMLEIVMKIREDEDFAKSIYDDCPRLQLLLDQHPDLRPIFEDPNLVRINFEQVYRNAGGVLPEDKQNEIYKKFKEILPIVVNHPLFKVFRFVLFIKKIYNFIFGGGLAMMKNIYISFLGFSGISMINPNGLLDMIGVPEDTHKETLYQAAEYMEDPAVQEQMKILLEGNPEDLDEAIEQDPDLRALRESDPLCAELMNDPSTMKILLDPDNLRALADCPDLIEADFANPDWMPPELDDPQFDEVVSADDDLFQSELIVDDELAETPAEEGTCTLLEGGSGIIEEMEQPEGGGASDKKQSKSQDSEGNSGGGGILSIAGNGLMGYMASELGLSPTNLFGGGDDFGVEGLVEQTENAVVETTQTATDAAIEEARNATDTAADGVQHATDTMVTEAQRVAEEDTMLDKIESTVAQAADENNKENEVPNGAA
jgi:hypothetical protein